MFDEGWYCEQLRQRLPGIKKNTVFFPVVPCFPFGDWNFSKYPNQYNDAIVGKWCLGLTPPENGSVVVHNVTQGHFGGEKNIYERFLKFDNQFLTPTSIVLVCRASLAGFPQARVQLYSYALTLGHLWGKPHYRARSLADDMRPGFSKFMFPLKIIE